MISKRPVTALVLSKPVRPITFALPLLVAFSIPWGIKFNGWLVFSTLGFFVVIGIYARSFDFGFIRTGLFKIQVWLSLILLAGLLHTSNIKSGIYDLDQNVTMLLFPILIYQWRSCGISISLLLWAFTAGCVVLTAYGFFYCWFYLDPPTKALAFSMGHSYYSDHINIHPTYLAVYFNLIFFFLTISVAKQRKKLRPLTLAGIMTLVVYCVFMITFLRSRTALATLIIVLLALACVTLVRRPFVIIGGLAALSLVVFMLISKETLIENLGRNPSAALDDRLEIWNSALKGASMSPLVGAGTGSAQQLIDYGYLENGYNEGFDNIYNAHNQYLQWLLRNGPIELLSYLGLFVLLVMRAVRSRNHLFVVMVALMALSMLTESMLERQKGIVFFYFFACSFYYLKHE